MNLKAANSQNYPISSNKVSEDLQSQGDYLAIHKKVVSDHELQKAYKKIDELEELLREQKEKTRQAENKAKRESSHYLEQLKCTQAMSRTIKAFLKIF